MRIFTQEGVLYEWEVKQGIKLEYVSLTVLEEGGIEDTDEEEVPATVMDLQLNEVRKDDEHDTKSKITTKLKQYPETRFRKNIRKVRRM